MNFYSFSFDVYNKLNDFSDTKAEADAFKSTHRAVVPGVYNLKKSGGRTTEQTKLLTTKEFSVAMDHGLTAMNTRFVVKSEKFCDEISDLRHRIVNHNVNNGDEGLDDSDIEHLQEEIDDDDDSEVEFDLLLPKPQTVMKIEHDTNEKSNEEANEDANEEANQETNDEMDTPNGIIENVQVDDVLLVGNINYEKNAANDFHFPEFQTTIRSSIAVVLRAWNTNVPFKFYLYDKKFIGVLIREVMLTHMGNTEEGMDEQGIAFIKRLFEIRVDGDEGRLSTFDESFKEKFECHMAKMSQRRK